MTDNFEQNSPIITYFLIFVILVFYFWVGINENLVSQYSIISISPETSIYEHFVRGLMANFLHWGFLHILFNSLILLYIWWLVERRFWSMIYLGLFLFSSLVVYLVVWGFSAEMTRTIWISWFNYANLTFLWIVLLLNKESLLWATWKDYLAVSTIFLFSGLVFANVSFLGHAWGYIAWIVYCGLAYFFIKEL